MKLGVSADSYIFTRGLIRNSGTGARWFESLELPLRYYKAHPPDFMSWLVGRCRRYHEAFGLDCLPVVLDGLDADHVLQLKKLVQESGLLPSTLALEPDNQDTAGHFFIAPQAEFRKALGNLTRQMEVAKTLGSLIVVAGNPPFRVNRFLKEIPLEKQLSRYSANIGSVAEIASSLGLKVALENKGDYRVSELIQVIRQAKHDNLMLNFDTGNTMVVVEDPIEAAVQAAPYTISIHLKDIFLHTVVWYGARIFGTPVGQGQLDFPKVLDIIERKSPDARNLFLDVEVNSYEGDEDRMVEDSLRFVRKNFQSYLT